MAKYVRRPETIEAFQFKEEMLVSDLPDWWLDHPAAVVAEKEAADAKIVGCEIRTEHGKTVANYSDYIIKDGNGDLWVCPANDFEAEYDEMVAA